MPSRLPSLVRLARLARLRRLPRLALALLAAATPLFPRLATAPAAPQPADVIIYGATPSGIAAAVEASRMGCSVIILEPGRFIGGMMTGGLGATDKGVVWTVGGLAREFFEEIWRYYLDPSVWKYEDRAAYLPRHGQTHTKDMQCQWYFEPHVAKLVFDRWLEKARPAVTLLRGERLDRAAGVEKQDAAITRITMESGRTFSGACFIDASYEGDLMAAAGVDFVIGREPNSRYGETLNGIRLDDADELETIDPFIEPGNPASGLLPRIEPRAPGRHGEGDHRVQAYNYRLCLTALEENRVPITRPPDYNPLNYELLLRALAQKKNLNPEKGFFTRVPMPNLKTDSNNTAGFSTDYIGGSHDWAGASYAEREKIEAAHRSYVQGFFWFLGHDPRVPAALRREVARWGLASDEFADNGHWPAQLYIREARRMVGQHVMQEDNFPHKRKNEAGRLLVAPARAPVPDPVAVGSYALDSHKVSLFLTENNTAAIEGHIYKGVAPYGISYRSLLPRPEQCRNLLVSVCVSASHVAYGSIRMEPVYMELGQAAAAAACLALRQGVPPHALPYPALRAHLQRAGAVLSPQKPKLPKNPR
ncbi:MAG: FAD-dependent oxidoreductase [Opitutaceae bacterium]|jgi:hypothetical protein|nr:FAD-dependent oxidoreductase [Opitutaceae bacterium]